MVSPATIDGWLVPMALRRLTPNRYSRLFQFNRVHPIELVVYHYTAGGFDGSLRWLTSKDSGVSAHFVIKKNGEPWQLAPLTDRTWHAGGQTSKWRGKGQVNNRSIGIEIENWGKLELKGDKLLTHKGTEHKGNATVMPNGDAWDAYTEEQIQALEALTKELAHSFPQLRAIDGLALGPPDGRLVGHQDVDPSRKIDPGPAFPWSRILAAVNN
jgi:N-acetyl-anhydromuramyl-L-alanine amidase AmpD